MQTIRKVELWYGRSLFTAERLIWEDEGDFQSHLEKEKPTVRNILGFQKLQHDRGER